MVTEAGDPIIAAGKYGLHVGGGQPGTSAVQVEGSFEIAGEIPLQE